MLDLLKIEWLKIKNYRVFLFMILFFLIGIFAANYIVYSLFQNVVNKSEAAVLLNKFNPYEFKYVWQSVSYTSGFLLMLPAMLLIILVTNEFAFRTNRQNIIDGWSRSQFINVKIVLALIFALCSTIFVVVAGFVFAFRTKTAISFDGFSHVGYFFIKAISYNLFAVLLSVMIRRTGFTIGVFFIYLGAENILAQIMDGWSMVIKRDHHLDFGSMGDYLPLSASDGLLAFPDNPLKSFAKSALPTDYTWLVMLLSFGYLALFYFINRRVVLKKDL